MPKPRYSVSLLLLVGLSALLSPIAVSACSKIIIPTKVQPSFSVHVYNDFGSVEGLRLKIVMPGSQDALAEATTDNKGIAVFHLPKLLWGGGLFLEPEHNVAGSQWPALDVEADAPTTSIEIQWPSQILRSRKLRGTIHIRNFPNSSEVFPLSHASLSIRSLISHEEIATAITDEKGSFQVAGIEAGLYYLQVNGTYKSDPRTPKGDIAVSIGGTEANDELSITTTYSSCGLEYEPGNEVRR